MLREHLVTRGLGSPCLLLRRLYTQYCGWGYSTLAEGSQPLNLPWPWLSFGKTGIIINLLERLLCGLNEMMFCSPGINQLTRKSARGALPGVFTGIQVPRGS